MVTLDYRDINKEKSLQFMIMMKNKIEQLFSSEECHILFNTLPFKKNNQYHTTIILRSENIRTILQALEIDILRNSKLSVIFS